jgi:hypothetical protein
MDKNRDPGNGLKIKKSGSRILNTALHGYVVLKEQKIGNTNRENRTARGNFLNPQKTYQRKKI